MRLNDSSERSQRSYDVHFRAAIGGNSLRPRSDLSQNSTFHDLRISRIL